MSYFFKKFTFCVFIFTLFGASESFGGFDDLFQRDGDHFSFECCRVGWLYRKLIGGKPFEAWASHANSNSELKPGASVWGAELEGTVSSVKESAPEVLDDLFLQLGLKLDNSADSEILEIFNDYCDQVAQGKIPRFHFDASFTKNDRMYPEGSFHLYYFVGESGASASADGQNFREVFRNLFKKSR